MLRGHAVRGVAFCWWRAWKLNISGVEARAIKADFIAAIKALRHPKTKSLDIKSAPQSTSFQSQSHSKIEVSRRSKSLQN